MPKQSFYPIRISISLDDELRDRLYAYAKNHKKSAGEVIRDSIISLKLPKNK